MTDCPECNCKEDKLHEDFDNKLEILLDEVRGELPPYLIMISLMREFKIDACFYHDCYFHLVGESMDMFNHNLRTMFDDIQGHKKEEIEKIKGDLLNAPSTL